MEAMRHTGATVLGLSILDKQMLEAKKETGEISQVTQRQSSIFPIWSARQSLILFIWYIESL